MKKTLRILTVAIATFSVSAAQAQGPVTIGDITYSFYTSGNAYVKSVAAGVKEVTIPNTITVEGEEKTVTGIGERAFENNTDIEKVHLSREGNYGVQIGKYAFKGATSLNTLNYTEDSGKAATYLRDGIVFIPTSSTLRDYAFEGCKSITAVSSVYTKQNVATGAFKDCTSLDSVALGKTCVAIGDSAFMGCGSLRIISGCTGTDEGSKLERVGAYAFKNCSDLSTIGSTGRFYFYEATELGEGACEGCASVTYVTIPNITEIKKNTFKDCSALIRIGGTEDRVRPVATVIGESAFEGCTSMTYVVASNLEEIGAKAFKDTGIETFFAGSGTYYTNRITLSEKVTKIGDEAFANTPCQTVFFNKGVVPEEMGADIFTGETTKRLLLPIENLIHESYYKLKEQGKPQALLNLPVDGKIRVISANMPLSLGLDAFVVKYVKSVTETAAGITVETEEVPEKVLPVGHALIVEHTSDKGVNCFLGILEENPTVDYTNYLVPNLTETTLPLSDGNTNYYTFAPTSQDDFSTFAKVTDETTLAAGTGYIKVVGGKADSAVTGIHEVKTESRTDNVWYNLNGMRVDNPQKGGIYILNGKKIILR